MELKQIESFVRVAELGSFTKAAQALNIPQPLLSRHVRHLEVELHQSLAGGFDAPLYGANGCVHSD